LFETLFSGVLLILQKVPFSEDWSIFKIVLFFTKSTRKLSLSVLCGSTSQQWVKEETFDLYKPVLFAPKGSFLEQMGKVIQKRNQLTQIYMESGL